MKITAVESIVLEIPYRTSGGRQFIAGRPAAGVNVVLIRLETDRGIVGWGEAFGHAVTQGTRTVFDTLVAPLLIGRDAADIDALMHDLQQKLHLFGRSGPVMYALSGVDIALWDIAGKAACVPLARMLGAANRTSLAAYASLLRCSGLDTLAASCREAVALGYCYIKLHEITEPAMRVARETVGPDVALMLDTNCPWSVAQACDMVAALRPHDLFWLEEPVWPPEDYAGLARVRAAGAVVAAGENAAGLIDLQRALELHALDVVQPSITKIGGLSEMRRIAALAEGAGVQLAPHSPYFGPGLLATIQLAAALRQDVLIERLFIALEASPYPSWAVDPQGGRLRVPQQPGLGCDPDPAVVARYRTGAPNIIRAS